MKDLDIQEEEDDILYSLNDELIENENENKSNNPPKIKKKKEKEK